MLEYRLLGGAESRAAVRRDNLIIDAGAHVGQDTAYYIAKGFDVVAIEANPELAEQLGDRFAADVAAGRLRILNTAVAPTSGTQRLAVADEITIWSSLSPALVSRNEAVGTRYRYVDVPAISFEEVLQDVGVPYYLKVDIEGFDMLCVKGLHKFSDRPAFVSIESHVSIADSSWESVFDELAHLWVLGYRGFQFVNQNHHPRVTLPIPSREGKYVDHTFTESSSGPFGEEAPGRWRSVGPTIAEGTGLWLHHNFAGFGGRWASSRIAQRYLQTLASVGRMIGWYDLHARLG